MKTVLVVDDKEMMRDSVATTLTRKGHVAVACASGEAAIEKLGRRPADVVVTDPGEVLETVRRMTDGRGADFVIESVGLPALYRQALELIRPGGHVAAFGLTGPGETLPLDILETILKENSIKGSVAGMGEDMHDALTLVSHGRFRTDAFVNAVYALDDIQEAFDSLAARPGDLKTQIAF